MNRLLELLAKKKSKFLTPEEQVELSGLLSSDDARMFSNIVDELFEMPADIKSVTTEDVNAAVNRIIEEIETETAKPKRQFRSFSLWRAGAAAVLLITVGLTIFFLVKNQKNVRSESIVQTQKGSKSITTLPDGTKVWINSETKITYEKSFGEEARNVFLEGEAYFNVVHDKARPFIVHTKDMQIKVTGTVFNVRAYPDEANAQTTLISGSVEVQLNNNSSTKVLLKPNEKVIVKQSKVNDSLQQAQVLTPQLSIVPVKSKNINDTVCTEIQWINNRLALEDQSLTEIIPILERWYNVQVVVNKKPVNQRLFNGVFESENLDDVMRALALTLGFNYQIKGDKIYIN